MFSLLFSVFRMPEAAAERRRRPVAHGRIAGGTEVSRRPDLCGCQVSSAGLDVAGLSALSGLKRILSTGRALKKDKKEEAKKEAKKEAKREKRVIDDKDRHKPFGKTAWAPVDDVYVKRFYPRTVHSAADGIGMLKKFQELDFTPADQPVYIDLKLDMKLEKKVGKRRPSHQHTATECPVFTEPKVLLE